MNERRKGRLIVFEGIDGVGKTTQADALAALLRRKGRDVVRSREPTSGPWGQKLRDSQLTARLSPDEELDLFLKDRRQHIEELIQPSLDAGRVVILDRYYFSTVAYQGARGAHTPDELLAANEAFAPRPDLLIILDMDPAHGLGRIERLRGETLDTFEVPELLARSRRIFLDLAERLEYAHVVDAGRSLDEVSREVVELAVRCLGPAPG